MKRTPLGQIGLYFSVIVLVSPAVLFFLWMLSLSLKNELDNTAWPPVFIPNPPTFDNFIDVFAKNDFLTYTINSVIVSFSATGLAILFGVPAGYGIAKAKATKAAALILIARVTPGLSYLIPLFLLFQWLGLIGTLVPLVITHLVITVPIVVWIMIGFFEGLPGELEEAALVDGATIWQAFLYVAMPLARPGITVATILAFIFSWNKFLHQFFNRMNRLKIGTPLHIITIHKIAECIFIIQLHKRCLHSRCIVRYKIIRGDTTTTINNMTGCCFK